VTPVLVAALVTTALLLGARRPRALGRFGDPHRLNREPLNGYPLNTYARNRPFARRQLAWLARRFRRRSRHTQERRAAIELVAAFAAELRAGQPVRQALVRAQESNPGDFAGHVVAVAELGGDVPNALESVAMQCELPVLRSLGALWRVAEGSGAGLAQAADRLAIAQAESELARAELSAQLVGPRTTARVLAGLPILGMLLGSGLGASPLTWLIGSLWGWLILTIGCALEVAGLWWIARLTRSVEVLL
jgi:tight adherence protein B